MTPSPRISCSSAAIFERVSIAGLLPRSTALPAGAAQIFYGPNPDIDARGHKLCWIEQAKESGILNLT
jgi:hypothetical protein